MSDTIEQKHSREPALSCRHLWKVFGPQVENIQSMTEGMSDASVRSLSNDIRADGGVVAVADISIDIMPGEFFVLMGLSGSGKSTLLRCMSRLTEPSSGEVIFEGRDLRSLSDAELRVIRREKMGMVFQHFGLFPHMTVLENVGFPLRVQKIARAQRDEKAREMIALVGLEGREEAFPDQLSGGQKQRVGIARSLAVDPQLWFLDEPFSALDPLIRGQMQGELLSLQQKFHKTIVFVTHDFMEAVRLADRIAIMKDGIIEQIGTPAEIVLEPATDYVAEFVAEAPRSKIIRLRHLLGQADAGNPGGGKDGALLDPDMTLEDALADSVKHGGAFDVSDGKGGFMGSIDPERMARALQGRPIHGA